MNAEVTDITTKRFGLRLQEILADKSCNDQLLRIFNLLQNYNDLTRPREEFASKPFIVYTLGEYPFVIIAPHTGASCDLITKISEIIRTNPSHLKG